MGRTADVMIIYYQYSLNINTTAHIFEILTTFFQKGLFRNNEWIGRASVLYCNAIGEIIISERGGESCAKHPHVSRGICAAQKVWVEVALEMAGVAQAN